MEDSAALSRKPKRDDVEAGAAAEFPKALPAQLENRMMNGIRTSGSALVVLIARKGSKSSTAGRG